MHACVCGTHCMCVCMCECVHACVCACVRVNNIDTCSCNPEVNCRQSSVYLGLAPVGDNQG